MSTRLAAEISLRLTCCSRRNWSTRKKAFVTGNIMLLTFSIYAGSSIYTASIPGLMQEYNSSLVVATLGLSLFVVFYGLGPSILVPLQELPSLGRNPVYLTSLALFALFTMASALAKNMATVLVTRALAGFFGSPALATGGATLADMWPSQKLAYVIGMWSMGAVLGPVAAPTIGGFSAQYLGWRWPLWILFFINCFSWTVLFFFLPETFHANILYKRAARLRALTAQEDIKSHGQKEQEAQPFPQLIKNSLTRPLLLLTDPAPLFLSVYLGFVYALFYVSSFVRSFGNLQLTLLFSLSYSSNLSPSCLVISTTSDWASKDLHSSATLSPASSHSECTVLTKNGTSTRNIRTGMSRNRKSD